MNATFQSSSGDKSVPATFRFDASSVQWKKFFTDGCFYRILHVDVAARTAEMLVKFEPGGRCMNHRHVAVVSTMVLDGKLWVRDLAAEQETMKIKPAGHFSVAGKNEIHIEGGGADGAIVYYNMRTDGDVIYESLDASLNVVRSITVEDFEADWRKHWPGDGAARECDTGTGGNGTDEHPV
jgi:quercetin dioxygenase-like cupin family protein